MPHAYGEAWAITLKQRGHCPPSVLGPPIGLDYGPTECLDNHILMIMHVYCTLLTCIIQDMGGMKTTLCTLNITTLDGYSCTEHLLALKRCAPHLSHRCSNLLYPCELTEHVECIKEWLLGFIVRSLKDWILRTYGWDSAVETLKHFQRGHRNICIRRSLPWWYSSAVLGVSTRIKPGEIAITGSIKDPV